jgi:putative tricarboxylic transport membrane protein
LIDKKDFASSLFLLVLGLFLAFQSLRLSVWSQFGPDEGFFPLAIAVVIIVLSLIILLKALHPARAPVGTGVVGTWREKGQAIVRVSFYAILMVGYGLLMEKLGFLIASTLLLFPLAKIVERQSWTKALMLVGISLATSYILFAYVLGVPLPKGPVTGW